MNALIASFQAGEMSPLLEGRGDIEAIRSGCRRLRNMIPVGLGPAFQRPGTLFCGRQATDSSRVRLFGYAFSQSVAYQIELGDFYARFWYAGQLVETQPGIPPGSGVVSAVGTPLMLDTPWTYDEVFELQIVTANDVIWLCHRNHWPRRLIRYGVGDWRIDEMPVVFPPLRDVNAADITIAADATSGAVNLTAAGGDVFQAADVGGYYGISHRRDLPTTQISLSEGSADATALLSLTADPADGEQIAVGPVVYTFKTAVAAANHITRGGGVAVTRANIVKAVTGTGTAGADYGVGTVPHPLVTADNGGAVSGGTKATSTLTINSQLYPGATVSVDGTTLAAVASGAGAGQFNLGANKEATLDNIITAMNAVVATAQLAARVGNQSVCTAATAGTAGNGIAVARNTGGGASLNWLQWSGSTLSGGTDAATERVLITAKAPGAEGNGIVLSETLAAGSWSTAATAGGATATRESDPLDIIGDWEVFSYGKWYGTLKLLIERTPGVWETLRAWDSKNDFNAQASGTVEGQKRLKLIYTGTGTEADGASPRATLSALDAMVAGVVKITGVTDSTHAAGTVVKPLFSTAATYDWAEGAWSDRRGYPAAVALHEQRLVFARDKSVWGSQVSGFDNFQRLALEDASFAYNLAAAQGNQILSLLSHRGLIVLTDGDEWLMDGGPQSATITPSQLRAERKSGYGSAKVPPVLMLSSVFFVQQGGQRLNEYVFDFQQDGYEAVDLTELAEHLGAEVFVSMAWAQNPHGVLWAVTQEGSLLSMTYRRKAGLIAWAKHETPHGAFESVAVTPGAGGISDVWVTVRRMINGATVRTVERFDNAHWTKVKAGGDWLNVADGAVVATTPAATITGLDHLEGCTVGVLTDGAIHSDLVVAGGQITLAEAFTIAAVVGLPPTAEIQPMPLEIMLKDGTSTGKKFRAGKADVRFYQAGACEYADSEDANFYPVEFRRASDPMDAPVPPFSGLKKLDNAGSYADGTRVILRNATMLPLHVLSMVLETSVHGD